MRRTVPFLGRFFYFRKMTVRLNQICNTIFRVSVLSFCLIIAINARSQSRTKGPCEYKMSLIKPKCHKCKKRDRVAKVVYGRLRMTDEYRAQVNSEKIRPAGCLVSKCQSEWYCYRDNIGIIKRRFVTK